jgi:glycosyltransferase involved in cell wall biosynthesis
MRKLTIIGHFYEDKYISSGQTIRSQTIYKTLVKNYGVNQVLRLDTSTFLKTPFSSLIKLMYYYFNSNNFIIVSTLSGLKKILNIIPFFYFITKKNIIFIAIGNTITGVKQSEIAKILKFVRYILVQTLGIKNALNRIGVNNVEIFHNYRITTIANETTSNSEKVLDRVCTFSRVSKDKGITSAINSTARINSIYKKGLKIDIYGTIEDDYKVEFYELLKNNSHAEYKGLVLEADVCKVLSKYLLVLFTSTYSGEGFPGTILDSLRCGVPVIAFDWMYNSEIIKDNYNGHIVPINYLEKLEKSILLHLESRSFNQLLRNNCLEDSIKYSEEIAFKILNKIIG